jgi:hypothetical protein
MRLGMVKNDPANPYGALDKVLGEPVARPFSATRLIGGKLRNLYDDAGQQEMLALNRLLRVLEDEPAAD